jgi:dipeptidyl-peptidase 4
MSVKSFCTAIKAILPAVGLTVLCTNAAIAETAEMSRERYARAANFLASDHPTLAFGTKLEPTWSSDSAWMWYVLDRTDGRHVIEVSTSDGISKEPFVLSKLAGPLSQILEQSVDPQWLPITSYQRLSADSYRLIADEQAIDCNTASLHCTKVTEPFRDIADNGSVISPSQKKAIGYQQKNLIVHDVGGERSQLTQDGTTDVEYGRDTSGNPASAPSGLWSPDGVYFATFRLKTTGVRRHRVEKYVPENKYGKWPSDALEIFHPVPTDTIIPELQIVIINVETSELIEVPEGKLGDFDDPFGRGLAWWSPDSKTISFFDFSRDYTVATLKRFELLSKTTKKVLTEDGGGGHVSLNPYRDPPILASLTLSDAFLMYSERDGWGHLYVHDAKSGKQLYQSTKGKWNVHALKHIDEKRGWIYFLANGREAGQDPYHPKLYRVRFNGSGMQLLTPEAGAHRVSFAPSGDWFVDSWSTVSTPTQHALKRANGTLSKKFADADVSALALLGWKPPLRFKTRSSDDSTDLFGTMFFPTDFDERKTYPIIDHIYGGPQLVMAPWGFADAMYDPQLSFWSSQALAELGFIVITFDGRGTPLRSRSFHHFSLGENFADGGALQDHAAAIKQLSSRHKYIDRGRVGILGFSSGGWSAARALLKYPKQFHVGVAHAGDHDQRLSYSTWNDRYTGRRELHTGIYDRLSNSALASNLQGHLLLITGSYDRTVPIAHTLQLTHALIAQNKDFELLIVPDEDHVDNNPYVIRRTWDYFVKNLLNQQPPKEFLINRPVVTGD